MADKHNKTPLQRNAEHASRSRALHRHRSHRQGFGNPDALCPTTNLTSTRADSSPECLPPDRSAEILRWAHETARTPTGTSAHNSARPVHPTANPNRTQLRRGHSCAESPAMISRNAATPRRPAHRTTQPTKSALKTNSAQAQVQDGGQRHVMWGGESRRSPSLDARGRQEYLRYHPLPSRMDWINSRRQTEAEEKREMEGDDNADETDLRQESSEEDDDNDDKDNSDPPPGSLEEDNDKNDNDDKDNSDPPPGSLEEDNDKNDKEDKDNSDPPPGSLEEDNDKSDKNDKDNSDPPPGSVEGRVSFEL
ncbi:hypothetical protein EDC01DRAFT_729856 [Geopyxis carbonaria]|nr:hypothetical protein EDC01DRAFT_729856 [Geopyxis carbonaria]